MGQGIRPRVGRWFVPAVTAMLVAAVPLVGQPPGQDPVDALAQVLKSGPLDVKERTSALEEKARSLKDISQLRRALSLAEWQEEFRAEGGGAVNPVRQEIGRRLEQRLRAVLTTGDALAKQAAVRLIGEMGTSVLNTEEGAKGGYSRRFTEDLIKLTGPANDRPVRLAAARSLGQILPDPEQANPALEKLLESNDTELRRTAAAALLEQLRNAVGRRSRSDTTSSAVRLPKEDVVSLGQSIFQICGRFANDPDRTVQRLCLESFQLICDEIADFLSVNPFLDNKERPLKARVEEVAKLLADQVPAIAAALKSPDCNNRRLAARVLEAIGLLRKVLSAPLDMARLARPPLARAEDDGDLVARAQPGDKEKGDAAGPAPGDGGESLRKGLVDALPAMTCGLGDPDPWVRVYVMNAIDSVGADAAPIVAALVQSARDRNVYVRWVTARVIGKFAPARPEAGVPTLAQLALDPDIDVRRAALFALFRYGDSLAVPAFPAIAKASSHGDADVRLVAIRVLRELTVPAGVALPALLANLRDQDTRVRRDSAEAIGRLGKAAASALPTLQWVFTSDPDSDVREAASDAVLAITGGGV
jgi:HEAT repeat protein